MRPTLPPSRLGRHHFAHLRAVAMGVPVTTAARQYLGINHGHQADLAHRATVQMVRAIARRHSERAWRLIGLSIRADRAHEDAAPTLESFIADKGLDDWSEADIRDFYLDAYPAQAESAASAKSKRRERLLGTQLELLARLEKLSVIPPAGTDLVADWYDPETAYKLVTGGMLTLDVLAERIRIGGQWHAGMPGIGPTKARRIELFLRGLLGDQVLAKRTFHIPTGSVVVGAAVVRQVPLPVPVTHLAHESASQILAARTDAEAINEWVAAKAGSPKTTTSYIREARRLLLWLQEAAGGKTFTSMTVADCTAYMTFLADIPAHWISRARAKPGSPNWAPFRGQLDHKSRQFSVTVVAALFKWLHAAQYIQRNPWVMVKHDAGDDPRSAMPLLDTKAFSEGTMTELLRVIEHQAFSLSRERILFIVRFIEAVGLRSQEMISARLADFSLEPEGWVLQVHGKGGKNRVVAIPGQAMGALKRYLQARGLDGIETAGSTAPLLSSLSDTMTPIGYQALYEHVKNWLAKAVIRSNLPERERSRIAKASTHWLRHTFGTRAVAREVPMDVIQAQLGHVTIQTTMSIYGRAPIKRRTQELEKAFSGFDT